MRARPDSLMIRGWGMPAALQGCMMPSTTSAQYSATW